MYKHIIWDFDGTLFDSYPVMTTAFKKVLENEGIYESDKKIMSLMKISESHLIEYYQNKYGISKDFVSIYKNYRKEIEEELLEPFSNVKHVCRTIHFVDKKNYLYTHRGKSSIEYLKKYRMYKYFEGFITKENKFPRKPHPEAILFLINKYNIKKDEAIMIGDRDIDLLAAKNAGIDACLFNNNQVHECEYADYSISDFIQLLDLFEVNGVG